MAEEGKDLPLDHSSPAGGRGADRALVGFVKEVKAALLSAAAEAAQRGLAITGARLQVTSTLRSGPAGSIGASGGIGGLFLDVAQLSFHRQRSDSHQLDISFEPPPPATAPTTADPPAIRGGTQAGGAGATGAGAGGPGAGDAGMSAATRGAGAVARGNTAGDEETGAAEPGDADGLGTAADAQADPGLMAPLFRKRSRSPDGGSLAQQLAAVVQSVAEVAGVLFAEEPACRPAGGGSGGAAGGAPSAAAASAADGGSGGASSDAAGTRAAPRGDVSHVAGGPQVPLATVTLNLGVDEGGTVELIFGGRRDVQTAHVLTLTFGRLQA